MNSTRLTAARVDAQIRRSRIAGIVFPVLRAAACCAFASLTLATISTGCAVATEENGARAEESATSSEAATASATCSGNGCGGTGCWAITGWSSAGGPVGSHPILAPTSCTTTPAGTGWIAVTYAYGNPSPTPLWLNISLGDSHVTGTTFAPLLVFNSCSGTTPTLTVDAIVSTSGGNTEPIYAPAPCHAAKSVDGDYDGDGKTDLTVRRPSQTKFYTIRSSASLGPNVVFGAAGDIPVDGDFDGDGITDYTLWTPATGIWTVRQSSTGGTYATRQWGTLGDVPLSGDFDGDGKADYAIWRPSQTKFYVIRSSGTLGPNVVFGSATDIPVDGDFDGDGKNDYVLWTPSTGTWNVYQSSTLTHVTTQWGTAGDIPLSGDFDGDGKTDYSIWRPSQTKFYTIRSGGGLSPNMVWGSAGDVPVNGDFDGDGKADWALWTPATGMWNIVKSSGATSAHFTQQWGTSGDVPMPPAQQ